MALFCIWDANFHNNIANINAHQGTVFVCSWSPDGKIIATAGQDSTVRIWDVDTAQEVGPRLLHLPDGQAAIVSGDGRDILAASSEARRWLGWNLPDPTGTITRLPAETFGPLPPLTVKGQAPDRNVAKNRMLAV